MPDVIPVPDVPDVPDGHSSKFSEDSERSPSAIGDFHWQSKHGGSFGG